LKLSVKFSKKFSVTFFKDFVKIFKNSAPKPENTTFSYCYITRTGNPEPCARKDCRNSKDCRTPGCLLNLKKRKITQLKLQPELFSYFIYTENKQSGKQEQQIAT